MIVSFLLQKELEALVRDASGLFRSQYLLFITFA